MTLSEIFKNIVGSSGDVDIPTVNIEQNTNQQNSTVEVTQPIQQNSTIELNQPIQQNSTVESVNQLTETIKRLEEENLKLKEANKQLLTQTPSEPERTIEDFIYQICVPERRKENK